MPDAHPSTPTLLKNISLPHWGLRLSERRVLLVAGDAFCACLGMLVALWLWTLTSGAQFSPSYLASKALWLVLLTPAWACCSRSGYGR